MIGDETDMLGRLKQVLPSRWFPDISPNLDSVLSGIAWAWAWCYELLQTAKAQTRIGTAQGIWLDLISADYFGTMLQRRPLEFDSDYSLRIRAELVRERCTRRAVESVLLDLTGWAPTIFEPANPTDTGGYASSSGSGGGVAYGVAGGWGSLNLPLQFFVTAARRSNAGIANVAGWNSGGGGYGQGMLEYTDLSMSQDYVQNSDIYSAVSRVLPIGTIAWTRIAS